jgi:hypothetical protein
VPSLGLVAAVIVGGALPVRALGFSWRASLLVALGAYPTSLLLAFLASSYLPRYATPEPLYAAILVLGLTLSLLVVLADSAYTRTVALLGVGGLGVAVAVLALLVPAGAGLEFPLTLGAWLVLPGIARLVLGSVPA